MLNTKLIHPDILDALGRAGHGAQVLIADGNYPFSTTGGSNTSVVHLNLSPGLVSCTQALEALLSVQPVEAATLMDVPAGDPDPSIWAEFNQILQDNGNSFPFTKVERFAFYDLIAQENTALIIATGDQRLYANLLLTLGCA